MIAKPFDQIEKGDIESLVANGVSEGRALEYKQELPGNSDDNKREFLADVSSFANAVGGDLVLGVREVRDANGKPTGTPEVANGLTGINVDSEINRLDNIIRDAIDPRIPLVQIRAIEGFPDGPVMVMRVPKSWASPHMVVFKGSSRFFSRDNRGKYQLDVREIRAAFALSENLAERLRGFRDGRLAKIVAGETPIYDDSPSKIVLHLVPIGALDPASQVDVTQAAVGASSKWLWPMHTSGMSTRFNFDGLLLYAGPQNKKTNTYVQVFRNGIIEAVEASWLMPLSKQKIIVSPGFELMLIDAVQRYLKAQRDFALEPPVFVMLTLVGIEGFEIRLPRERPDYHYPIDRSVLILPERLVQSFDTDGADVLHSAFDAVWQAAGHAFCAHYDRAGKWTAGAS